MLSSINEHCATVALKSNIKYMREGERDDHIPGKSVVIATHWLEMIGIMWGTSAEPLVLFKVGSVQFTK
jgi:hypothetical protein